MPTKIHTFTDPEASAPALSESQFQILVDLLTPGYELSSIMLADYKARQAQEEVPQGDSGDTA